jgi:coenzyme F420-reducing hydrogenase delta subunit
MSALKEKLKNHIELLNPEEKDPDKTLYQLLLSEYRRRLAHYQNIDTLLNKKYKMRYNEFVKDEVVKREGFSWEVESDAMEWEKAIDGIKTYQKKIKELGPIENR